MGLITKSGFLAGVASGLIMMFYLFTRNWLLNNVIGTGLVVVMLRTFHLPNMFIGTLLLGLAFFYDVFWVFFSDRIFGTSVMSFVATNIDLPMKLLCPNMILESPMMSCSLLRLGDMVLPGLMIVLARKID